MKVLKLIILFPFLINLGCNDQDGEGTAQIAGIKSQVLKKFSDSLLADTFTVKVSGTNLDSQKLDFRITNSKGREIYQVNIPSATLLKNYDATIDLKKGKNQATFLQSEVSRFFDEENFMEPAITEMETPDKNVPDLAFYEELRRSGLNGFFYRLGKEDKIYIGWSAKENEVKVYYNCCK
ncbi:hypothetical protein [Pedobacter sp. JCM 36344]|uniref:hypothetical protein n=1 Tax=Pedobacter sp. JCM 36344 TaxID=3374280 RepID=UPI00397D311B